MTNFDITIESVETGKKILLPVRQGIGEKNAWEKDSPRISTGIPISTMTLPSNYHKSLGIALKGDPDGSFRDHINGNTIDFWVHLVHLEVSNPETILDSHLNILAKERYENVEAAAIKAESDDVVPWISAQFTAPPMEQLQTMNQFEIEMLPPTEKSD